MEMHGRCVGGGGRKLPAVARYAGIIDEAYQKARNQGMQARIELVDEQQFAVLGRLQQRPKQADEPLGARGLEYRVQPQRYQSIAGVQELDRAMGAAPPKKSAAGRRSRIGRRRVLLGKAHVVDMA